MTQALAENQAIQDFFQKYYDGRSQFSPQARGRGWDLDYTSYLQSEFVQRTVFRTLIKTLRFASITPLKVLDVGCGDGHKLRWFVEWGARPENLFGVDASPTIVQEAQRLSAPAMSFQHAMGSALPAPDRSFDLVTCFGVIIHVMDNQMIRDMATEFNRVIRPGGALILVVANELSQYSKTNWMSGRVRTFDRESREVENLFENWKCLARDDSCNEEWGPLLDFLANIAAERPEDKAKIMARASDDDFLLQETFDYDIPKFCRLNSCGSLSLYVMQPK